MTTIVVSNKFWGSLTANQQEAFRKAAFAAARQERQWSVDDAAAYEANAKDRNITITEMSDSDREQLKHQSQKTYYKFKHAFSDGLIQEMRKLK